MAVYTIALSESDRSFVEDQLSSGAFPSTNELFSALIKDAKRLAARKKVESMIKESLESGEPIPVTAEYWKQLDGRLEERVKSEGWK